jgi:glycosyltransferase involved in cell wall biosynthesis
MLLDLLKKLNVIKPGVLIVGHDLKFLTPVIRHLESNEEIKLEKFTYKTHTIPDKPKLLKVLPRFDIIFCEWGLGNIRFISKNKRPNQKLIVRIHLQEFSTCFLKETQWENVDAMIFISEFQLGRFKSLFPEHAHKSRLIYNVIDCNELDREKEPDAKFTLGMMGILPARKSPHLGIGILKELKKHDSRFRISIKSKRPEELEWVWKRAEEKEYYEQFYNQIDALGLKDSVIFEPHGDDVSEWFRKVGFILSPSEFEGSHQSVAEGMAAGSIPVIRNWDGATPLYPEKYVWSTDQEAAKIILDHVNDTDFQKESRIVREYAKDHFDLSVILPLYDKLIESMIEK